MNCCGTREIPPQFPLIEYLNRVVVLHSLVNTPTLNGALGKITGYDAKTGRLVIQRLNLGVSPTLGYVRIKRENVRFLSEVVPQLVKPQTAEHLGRGGTLVVVEPPSLSAGPPPREGGPSVQLPQVASADRVTFSVDNPVNQLKSLFTSRNTKGAPVREASSDQPGEPQISTLHLPQSQNHTCSLCNEEVDATNSIMRCSNNHYVHPLCLAALLMSINQGNPLQPKCPLCHASIQVAPEKLADFLAHTVVSPQSQEVLQQIYQAITPEEIESKWTTKRILITVGVAVGVTGAAVAGGVAAYKLTKPKEPGADAELVS